MTAVPCMGGWCSKRTGCAHYHAVSDRTPFERLCELDRNDAFQPVQHEHMTTDKLPADPWGLTPHQRRIVASLCAHGLQKRVQTDLQLTENAAKDAIKQARRKVGADTTIGLVLAWDRWAREAAQSEVTHG